MRQKEQRLWDAMKRQFKGSSVWLQRIENLCVAGMPDVAAITTLGDTRWVELKAPTPRKKAETPVLGDREGMNVHQRGWHLKAAAMNVPSYILVRVEKDVFLVSGRFAAEINDWPLERMRKLAACSNWKEIVEFLSE